MGPTLMAPPQTMLDSTSVTSVWNRELGNITRQNFGLSACAAEHGPERLGARSQIDSPGGRDRVVVGPGGAQQASTG